MTPPAEVYLLVLPGVHLLDLAAPAQIFGHPDLQPAPRLHYVGPEPTLGSAQGLALAGLEPLPAALGENAWLLLIGSYRAYDRLASPPYRQAVDWLRTVATQPRLTAAICSGALLAGAAGLLDGRRCTSHHRLLEQLRRLAPRALVQEDCIFVADGALHTSAGITTGLDLCLQLVAQHWDHPTAAALARDLVLYQRRSGQEPQLSFWLDHRNHVHSRIHRVQDLILAAPGRAWQVADLAEAAHVSDRHLRRLFRDATGAGLLDYIQQARLELARQLLQQTALPIAQVAERCGFQAERSLRRCWHRWLPDTPSGYRATMAAPPTEGP